MIHLVVPWLPPSSNHAYENMRGGGRRLSEAGRSYKTETRVYLASRYPGALTCLRKNAARVLAVRFRFEQVENLGYPNTAKTRYKKFDGGNRMKLLEDTLHEAGGVDDCEVFQSFWEKTQGLPEQTELWVWDLELEGSPFDAILRAI